MLRTSLAAAIALTLAACGDKSPTPAPATPDPAAIAAATNAAVAEANAARDADETKIHADGGPAVYFVNLRDGQTVTSPFRVVFGLYGMGIAPAGVDQPSTGHHHLLIDTTLDDTEMKMAIAKDAQHMHFGAGQTETVLQLPAGQHTLQLVFGDLKHEMVKPAPVMSRKITITVK